MRSSLSLNQPLVSIFWLIKLDKWLRNLLLVAMGTVGLVIASKISIPLTPVPVTLQTLAIFFIAMTYGWRLGTATIITYLSVGLMGMPVFAGPLGGISVFLGPTGGYLIGFIPAVLISGYLSEHGFARNPVTVAIAALIASIPLYLLGLAMLSTFVGIHAAVSFGLKPFILGDLLKIIFLACVVPTFWKTTKLKND